MKPMLDSRVRSKKQRQKIVRGELEVARFKIPYRIFGNSDKHMLCVGGAKQSMAVFKSFVSRFTPEYSVILVDLPGHGKAKSLSGGQFATLDEQIEVLKALLEATSDGRRSLSVFGASWGTIVASGYAAKYPGIVDKMVLGSFGAKPNQTMTKVIRGGYDLYYKNGPEAIGPLIIQCFGSQIPEGYATNIIKQFSGMSHEEYLAFYEHCDFVAETENITEHIELAKIDADVMIINGENDSVIDLNDVRKATQLIKNCVWEVVPDAGHFLHFEDLAIIERYAAFFEGELSGVHLTSIVPKSESIAG